MDSYTEDGVITIQDNTQYVIMGGFEFPRVNCELHGKSHVIIYHDYNDDINMSNYKETHRFCLKCYLDLFVKLGLKNYVETESK